MTELEQKVIDAARAWAYIQHNVKLSDHEVLDLIEAVVTLDHYEHPEIIAEQRARHDKINQYLELVNRKRPLKRRETC